MKPHKHAELIKAWADGATIEARCVTPNEIGEWKTFTNPNWDVPYAVYRIKPEPKPDVVAKGIIQWNGNIVNGIADYATEFRVSEHWERDNIKLTFDGETGELKSAEVLK